MKTRGNEVDSGCEKQGLNETNYSRVDQVDFVEDSN